MKGLIDLDVHPTIEGTTDVLFPYMPEGWRKKFELRAKWPLPGTKDSHRLPHFVGKNISRLTAMTPDGRGAGTDPRFTAKDLLDRYGHESALLLPIQAADVSGLLDRNEAAVMAAAYNDYFLEHWIGADDRYRLAMVVAPQNPMASVAEIERTAGKRGVAGLYFPLVDVPIWSAHMEPILAAAHDAALPIVMHVHGTFGFVNAPTWGAGMPTTYAAMYSLLQHHAQGVLANLIWEGAFEKFPRLKVVFVEFGWSWVPALMWHMDAAWKSARKAMPWMTRPPSEYVVEHVRFTSEPALEIPNAKWESDYLEQMRAERTLCFSTDYPHWDGDDPGTVFRHISPELRQRIFRDNAIETFGERIRARRPASVA